MRNQKLIEKPGPESSEKRIENKAQKWIRPNCPWNVISLLFMYFNLVKFSKNLQNFLKRRLRRRFGRFAPENPETLQSKPPLEPKSCNRTPPRGVRDPIISSAWTPRRARTGSYASLVNTLKINIISKCWGHGDYVNRRHDSLPYFIQEKVKVRIYNLKKKTNWTLYKNEASILG